MLRQYRQYRACNYVQALMSIESMVVLSLGAAFLVGLALYASSHRSDDDNKEENRK
jgi:hypothetical protein